MFRLRLFALAGALLAVALAGCDFSRAEAMRAEAEARHAEAERARAEAERSRAEAEVAAVKAENARLRAELEEANKLLGRDVTPVERPPFPKR